MTAESARALRLSFLIPGFQGENLEISVGELDLAFILQQTLRRRGWSSVMSTKAVEDFLNRPLLRMRLGLGLQEQEVVGWLLRKEDPMAKDEGEEAPAPNETLQEDWVEI